MLGFANRFLAHQGLFVRYALILISALSVLSVNANETPKSLEWYSLDYQTVQGDFNGDGITDLLLQPRRPEGVNLISYGSKDSENNVEHLFENTESAPIKYNEQFWHSDHQLFTTGDFNGDGFDDLLTLYRSDLSKKDRKHRKVEGYVFSGSEAGLNLEKFDFKLKNNKKLPFLDSPEDYSYHTGDFNGDGKNDLFVQFTKHIQYPENNVNTSDAYHYVVLSNKKGKLKKVKQFISLNENSWLVEPFNPIIGDFNSDGRDDIFVQHFTPGNNHHLIPAAQNGELLTLQPVTIADNLMDMSWNASDVTLFPHDVNEDGILDLLRISKSEEDSGVVSLEKASNTSPQRMLKSLSSAQSPLALVGVQASSGCEEELFSVGLNSLSTSKSTAFLNPVSGAASFGSCPIDLPAPVPSPPSSISVPSTNSTGGFTVSWSKVFPYNGITPYYKLYQSKNGGSYTHIGSTSKTSWITSGLPTGSYRYRVQACDKYCSSYRYSNTITVNIYTPPPPPVAPSLSTISSYSNGNGWIHWSVSANASSFEVWRSINNGSYSKYATYSGTTGDAVVGLLLDGRHCYKVRGINAQGNGSFSNVVCITLNHKPSVSILAPYNGQVLTTSNSINVSATASDADSGDGISKVVLSVSGKGTYTITSAPYTKNFGQLSVGSYTITATAYDNRGANQSTTRSFSVKLPNVAPSISPLAPNNNSTILSTQPISAAANASDGDGSIKQVEFKLDSGSWKVDTTYPYSYNFGKLSAGSHRIHYRSKDNENKYSSSTPYRNITIRVNQAPSISPALPWNNTVFNALEYVTATASATDSDGDVKQVEFKVDSGSWKVDTTSPYSYNFGTQSIGSHTVYYRALDYDGKYSASTPTRSFTVRAPNIGPSISPLTPSANATYLTTQSVNASASASDSDGSVKQVDFRLDSGAWYSDTTYPYSYNFGKLSAGAHTIRYRAVDNENKYSTSQPLRSFNVEAPNVAPTVGPIAPQNNAQFDTSQSVVASALASDTDGSINQIEFKLDGGSWRAVYSFPYSYNFGTLSLGNHTIYYRAKDNENLYSAIHERHISVNAPPITIESPPEVHVESIPSDPNSKSETVGTIAGSFRVDESGGATYAIPLSIPTGIAGISPDVSINYHSSAGNGIMGIGWSVNAASTISRCRQTEEVNGISTGVTLTNSDRFCLDGQQLVAVTDEDGTQGEYGGDGTHYRTLIDSQARIISLGVSGNGPSYFTVERADGSFSEYGNSTSSVLLDTNDTAISWHVNSQKDHRNNEITYAYVSSDEGIGENELLIDTIVYSGNTIDFNYNSSAARTDTSTSYMAGLAFEQKSRLDDITISNHLENNINSYHFSYKNIPTGETVLEDVTQCDGTLTGSCLPATSFEWTDFETGFDSTGRYTSYTGDNIAAFRQLDFNADGLSDLVYLSFETDNGTLPGDVIDFTLYTLRGNGNSYSATNVPSSHTFSSTLFNGFALNKSIKVADVNNDGRQDILLYHEASTTNKGWTAFLSVENAQDGSAWEQVTLNSDFNNVHAPIVVLDATGDGRADILSRGGYDSAEGKDYLSLYTSTTELFDSQQKLYINSSNLASFGGVSAEFFGDFNGDGLTDFIASGSDFGTISYAVFMSEQASDGAISYTQVDNTRMATRNEEIFVGDLNGDGLSDLVYNGAPWSDLSEVKWRYLISNGIGFNAVEDMGLDTYPISDYGNFQLGDINVDGWLDFVYYDDKDEQWRYIPFIDSGFGTEQNMSVPGGVADLSLGGAQFVDYNGNGYSDLVYFDTDNDRIAKHPDTVSEPKAKIKQIDNGRSVLTDITYKPLTDDDVYSRGSNAESIADWGNGSAVYDVISASQVVSSVSSSAPGYDTSGNYQASNQITVEYHYAGLRVQAGGRGNLGFESLQTTDNQSGIVTTTTYRQDFPYTGMPITTTQMLGESVLSYSENTYPVSTTMLNGNKVYAPYIDSSVEHAYVINSDTGVTEQVSTTETDNTYAVFEDNHLQLTGIDIQVTDHTNGDATAATNTVNSYSADNENIANWWLNRVEQTTVTHSRSDSFPEADIVRISSFEYNETTGALERTEIEPGTDSNSDVNTFLGTLSCFDSVGNKTKEIIYSNHYTPTCTSAVPDTESNPLKVYRVSQTTYDDDMRFVVSTGNHTFTSSTVNARNNLNQITQSTDINGVITDIRYDAFGSEYFRRNNLGSFAKVDRRWSEDSTDIGAPAIDENYDFVERLTAAGKPISYKYVDKLGRTVAAVTQGFAASSYIYQYSQYDELGYVIKQSNPSYSQVAAYWTVNEVDDYGRVLSTTGADTLTTTEFSYSKTTVTTNVSSTLNGYTVDQSKTETKNVHGNVVSITDANAKSLTYLYDATGTLTKLTGVDNEEIINEVDILGRKTKTTDPDLGEWNYTYNAVGELATQTDAKSQVTTYYRDNQGRTVKRTVENEQTDYEYGTSHLIQSESIVDGMSRTFAYDGVGRNNHITTLLDGSNYYTQVTFDQFGRVFQNFDASTLDEKSKGIRYHYNARGYLIKEQEAEQGTEGQVYYEVTAMDALGNVTTFKQGDNRTTTRSYHADTGLVNTIVAGSQGAIQNWSHTYDGIGNLKVRNNLNGASERFEYDVLNRLTDVYRTINGAEVHTKDLTYADNGNIQTQGQGDLASSKSYTYDEEGAVTQCTNNAGPHAVTTMGTTVYCYDLNGNQTLSKNGASGDDIRTIEYSAFNKPISITANNKLTTFAYDSGHNRYKRVDADSGGGNATTTYYIGNVEVVINANGNQEVRRYLGGYAIATSYGSGTDELHYLHKNHLGSLDAITNAAAQITETASFDAFGQRRAADDLNIIVQAHTAISLQGLLGITTRGFTGQEHIDSADLIHMNGRIYDPVLARFVQADPIVQAPKNTQNLNRYSYIINNPLAGTDPSGYSFNLFQPLRWALGKLSYSGGQLVVGIGSMFCGPFVAACAAVGSYENARAHGYNRGTAMTAGIHAGISAGVFQIIGAAYSNTNLGCTSCYNAAGEMTTSALVGKTLSFAAAGGVMSSLQGGKFGHGFFAAGLGPLAGTSVTSNYYGQIAASAVIGGTISKLTGGKFANGAISAAYSAAYYGRSKQSITSPSSESQVADGNNSNSVTSVLEMDLAKPPTTRGYAMLLALEELFGPTVWDVKWAKNGRAQLLQVLATTDVNQIWGYISPKTCPNCNSFNNFFGEGGYNLDHTILEEYFHVVEQWNTGKMTKASYVWESVLNGYDDNKYELEAKGFATDNLANFRVSINQHMRK